MELAGLESSSLVGQKAASQSLVTPPKRLAGYLYVSCAVGLHKRMIQQRLLV